MRKELAAAAAEAWCFSRSISSDSPMEGELFKVMLAVLLLVAAVVELAVAASDRLLRCLWLRWLVEWWLDLSLSFSRFESLLSPVGLLRRLLFSESPFFEG